MKLLKFLETLEIYPSEYELHDLSDDIRKQIVVVTPSGTYKIKGTKFGDKRIEIHAS